ncbi:hypothetical protein [Poriferisphaera sp. WC338]|uniref:hypothetical protein n=1 Tax=Poriferisphaera sp. WC338 TaxID=3425129 RepID=UPI003D81A2F2
MTKGEMLRQCCCGLVVMLLFVMVGVVNAQDDSSAKMQAVEQLQKHAALGGMEVELGEMTSGRVTVFYDKEAYGKQSRDIGKFAVAVNEQMRQAQEDAAALQGKMEKVAARIDELVGGGNFAKKMWAGNAGRFFGKFIGQRGVVSVVDGEVVVYFLPQEKVRAFLAKGGKIKGHVYDEKTGQVAVNIEYGKSHKGGAEIRDGDLVAVLPVRPVNEAKEGALRGGLDSMLDRSLNPLTRGEGLDMTGLAVHELVEGTILAGRLKPKDPRFRWFSDGAANAITEIVLREQFGDEKADEFVSGWDDAMKKFAKVHVGLGRWEGKGYQIETGLEAQKELELARYGYATEEMRRVVKEKGEGAVKEMIDRMLVRSGGERVSGEDVLGGVGDVEPGIYKRLAAYEKYDSRENTARGYFDVMMKARDEGRYDDAVMAMLRIKEQRDGPEPQDYYFIAKLLRAGGHQKEADAVLPGLMGKVSGKNKVNVGKYLVAYELESKHPERVYDVAELVLAYEPEHVPSLVVRMVRQMKMGKLNQAGVTAKRIMVLEPNESSKVHQMAKQVRESVMATVGPVE